MSYEIVNRAGVPVASLDAWGVYAQLGCVELVEQVPRRGALEHYYRAIVTGQLTDVVDVPPLSVRTVLSSRVMSDAVADMAAALKEGTLQTDGPPTALRLRLDEQAWICARCRPERRNCSGRAKHAGRERPAALSSPLSRTRPDEGPT